MCCDVTFDETNFGSRHVKTVCQPVETNLQPTDSVGESDIKADMDIAADKDIGDLSGDNRPVVTDTLPRHSERSTVGVPPLRSGHEYACHHHFAYFVNNLDEPMSMQEAMEDELNTQPNGSKQQIPSTYHSLKTRHGSWLNFQNRDKQFLANGYFV